MVSQYPGTIDLFDAPAGTSLLTSPDHALQHVNVNGAVTAIETVLGTTSGTSVLQSFSAGQFPARINGSNVLQQRVSGTVDNAILGTPSITGGTHNNGTFGTPSITGGTATNTVLPGQTISTMRTTDFSSTATVAAELLAGTIVLGANTSGNVSIWAIAGAEAASGFGALLTRGTTTLVGIAGTSGVVAGGKNTAPLMWRDTGLTAGTYTYALKVRVSSGTVFVNASSQAGDHFASLIIQEDPKH